MSLSEQQMNADFESVERSIDSAMGVPESYPLCPSCRGYWHGLPRGSCSGSYRED
jgi:hypothetical protein